MKAFDAFTVFLFKCRIIPPWEIKLRAFMIAAEMFYEYGGSPAHPAKPGDDADRWIWERWGDYVGLARSQLVIHRPRW